MKCTNCGAEINDSAKFCPECGTKINKKIFCQNCGAELSATAKFCPECGTPVNKSTDTETKIHIEHLKTDEAIKKYTSFISQLSNHENRFDYLDENNLQQKDLSFLKFFDKCENQTLYYGSYRNIYVDYDCNPCCQEESNFEFAECILLTAHGIHQLLREGDGTISQNSILWKDIQRITPIQEDCDFTISLSHSNISVKDIHFHTNSLNGINVDGSIHKERNNKVWISLFQDLANAAKQETNFSSAFDTVLDSSLNDCSEPLTLDINTIFSYVEFCKAQMMKSYHYFTQDEIDEHLGHDYSLESIDYVESSNDRVVEVSLDDDGDVCVNALAKGRSTIRIGITISEISDSALSEIIIVAKFKAIEDNELILEDVHFEENEDNSNSGNNDTGKKILKGIAEFAGGFLSGYIEARNNFKDYEDY